MFFLLLKFIDKYVKVKTEKFEDFYSDESRFLITDKLKDSDHKHKLNERLNALMPQYLNANYTSESCSDVSSFCKTNISWEQDKLESTVQRLM